MPPNDVTSGKTYLELIQSTCPKPSQEAVQQPPKSKRERAEENWKILVRSLRKRFDCRHVLTLDFVGRYHQGIWPVRERV
eukprot:371081-Hanusia_phi.AAC.1